MIAPVSVGVTNQDLMAKRSTKVAMKINHVTNHHTHHSSTVFHFMFGNNVENSVTEMTHHSVTTCGYQRVSRGLKDYRVCVNERILVRYINHKDTVKPNTVNTSDEEPYIILCEHNQRYKYVTLRYLDVELIGHNYNYFNFRSKNVSHQRIDVIALINTGEQKEDALVVVHKEYLTYVNVGNTNRLDQITPLFQHTTHVINHVINNRRIYYVI